jgi:hypothetical protein
LPEVGPKTPLDRARHTYTDAFFRKDASVILEPEDLLEGGGDMTITNKAGNPLSADGTPAFELWKVDNPDGWSPYLGTSPQGVEGPTRQVSSAYPISRDSFMGNQPLIPGDLPPVSIGAAKLAQPEAPILVAESIGIEGYVASPETSPLFVAYTYAIRGLHSLLSPPTLVPPLASGQSISSLLPTQNIPKGITHIGMWLPEPGTSTPTIPGPFELQREVDITQYNPGKYDLTGPFRHDKKEPVVNETRLATPARPGFTVSPPGSVISFPLRQGDYRAAVVWTDANGESLPSSFVSSHVDIPEGQLRVYRPPNPPPRATGWRAYVHVDGTWNVVYHSIEQVGNEKPYSLETKYVYFWGWGSGQGPQVETAQDAPPPFPMDIFSYLVQRDLPTENTSGIEDPTEALPTPTVFGSVRLPAGTYYAGITESLRGRESILSPLSSITITDSQVLRMIRQDRVNRIPNGSNSEVGADRRPLDQTIITTNGAVVADGQTTLIRTSGAQTGTTPSSATRAVLVENTKAWRVEVKMSVEQPLSGVLQGSAEAVLEQISTSGSVTQTVLGSLSDMGTLDVKKIIHGSAETGLPGGSVQWLSTTVRADILVRYAGATKNLTIRVYRRELNPSQHAPRRASDETTRFPGPDDPATGSLPPGTDSWVSLPPEEGAPSEPTPGGSPALVEWPAPDRPSSSGIALEAKATFETALPSGWTQNVSGATLTRETTAALAGTYGLRSYKAS